MVKAYVIARVFYRTCEDGPTFPGRLLIVPERVTFEDVVERMTAGGVRLC